MRPRTVRIIAQDPSVRRDGRVLTAEISLPWEDLIEGPMGYAVYIVDYDATAGVMYRPAPPPPQRVRFPHSVHALLNDPEYHAINAYAIVLRTLLRFEFALGRRVAWGIRGHQIKVVPHAFQEANAYYSPDLEALVFGYIRGAEPDNNVYLCLSHDVVAHETAHALLDGLRDRFMCPSSSDQAALHEAFADIVALLSVFSLPELVRHLLDPVAEKAPPSPVGAPPAPPAPAMPTGFVPKSALTAENLKSTALLGLAEQMRCNNADVRVNALRRSVLIAPDPKILDRAEYEEEHRRGEVLVAAVMRAFLAAWAARIDRLTPADDGLVNIDMAAEQGADIADVMLTMVIRAIDYTPPIHIRFEDFLSALLTADAEVRVDDSRFGLRPHLLEQFAAYGIEPGSKTDDGRWCSPDHTLDRRGSHLGGLQTDPTEMFRHVWTNRDVLHLNPEAYTQVTSVRPCLRVSPADGFQVHETVVECTQYLKLSVTELPAYGLKPPPGMPDNVSVALEGGSTLILDEYGELKFEVTNRVLSRNADPAEVKKWQDRIDYLWQRGYVDGRNRSTDLATYHLERTLTDPADAADEAHRQLLVEREAWT